MSPPRLHWTAYLWPGLPHVWNRGSWAGFALAFGFGALADAMAIASLAWTEWLPGRVVGIGWCSLSVLWILAYVEARADWRRLATEWSAGDSRSPRERADAWFQAAQGAYLAGDWREAESYLQRVLKQDHRDVEARLLLATILRHQGAWEGAHQHLERLSRLDAAAPWEWEIACELESVRKAAASGKSEAENAEFEDAACAGRETPVVAEDRPATTTTPTWPASQATRSVESALCEKPASLPSSLGIAPFPSTGPPFEIGRMRESKASATESEPVLEPPCGDEVPFRRAA